MILPERPDPPRHYRLIIPRGGREWLTDNKRMHWRARSRQTKQWRDAACFYADIDEQLPKGLPGAHIVVELRFTTNQRRDPNNWNPTVKACIDGFVDAGIFRDDHASIIEGPDIRLGPLAPKGQAAVLIFHVWPKK